MSKLWPTCKTEVGTHMRTYASVRDARALQLPTQQSYPRPVVVVDAIIVSTRADSTWESCGSIATRSRIKARGTNVHCEGDCTNFRKHVRARPTTTSLHTRREHGFKIKQSVHAAPRRATASSRNHAAEARSPPREGGGPPCNLPALPQSGPCAARRSQPSQCTSD